MIDLADKLPGSLCATIPLIQSQTWDGTTINSEEVSNHQIALTPSTFNPGVEGVVPRGGFISFVIVRESFVVTANPSDFVRPKIQQRWSNELGSPPVGGWTDWFAGQDWIGTDTPGRHVRMWQTHGRTNTTGRIGNNFFNLTLGSGSTFNLFSYGMAVRAQLSGNNASGSASFTGSVYMLVHGSRRHARRRQRRRARLQAGEMFE
jgi:hypothetical protein